MLRVAIRTDASASIGTGHLQRCLALAEALRATGARVLLVTRSLGVALPAGATHRGIELAELAAPKDPTAFADGSGGSRHAGWAGVDAACDARETVQAVRDWGGADRVVVDHYAFDAVWHLAVADALAAPVAVIDDLADRPLHTDLLVDHNLADHRRKYTSRLLAPARILGGPRFALLGPGYRDASPREPGGPVRSVGIFMGGVDAAGLSCVALRACRAGAGYSGRIEIATTSANPHLEALRAEAARWAATELLVDAPDLVDFHRRQDLEIGAGGGATWERCCLGVPALLVSAAANQLHVVRTLAEQGVVASADADADDGDLEAALGRTFAALLGDSARREAMACAGRTLVDGVGALRVALALSASHVRVRPASLPDGAMLHRWRNAPQTRAYSHDARPIDPDEHAAWLVRALADAGRRLFVGHVGERDVGAIRFDVEPGGDARVSLYLDPELHGLGLGPAMFSAGEAALATEGGTARRLVATVLEDNKASQRMFAARGYVRCGEMWAKPLAGSIDDVAGAPEVER
jgi:UDP-2,4-diacetamido-2,4,6-trideoxy-beta-L-altropyranose hydrolase